jgi:hypothetical protein
MAQRDKILDGLAWASLPEHARIARISAQLVRKLGIYSKEHTKQFVRETVRDTAPPYGRGKAIFEAVEVEYRRQLPIHRKRQKRHAAWSDYQKHMAHRSTRLNHAYAAAFSRPHYSPTKSYDGAGTWDEQTAWNEAERERDKGDECVGLTHQEGHVVALVDIERGSTAVHIATRLKKGPITRTYLRCNLNGRHSYPANLAEAAISLGGPKVRTALSKNKKVVTDWVGRRTFIHHEGQDHHPPGIEEVRWRCVVYEDRPGYAGIPRPTPVAAEVYADGPVVVEVNTDSHQWNDYD